jgi:hypothetical protein
VHHHRPPAVAETAPFAHDVAAGQGQPIERQVARGRHVEETEKGGACGPFNDGGRHRPRDKDLLGRTRGGELPLHRDGRGSPPDGERTVNRERPRPPFAGTRPLSVARTAPKPMRSWPTPGHLTAAYAPPWAPRRIPLAGARVPVGSQAVENPLPPVALTALPSWCLGWSWRGPSAAEGWAGRVAPSS